MKQAREKKAVAANAAVATSAHQRMGVPCTAGNSASRTKNAAKTTPNARSEPATTFLCETIGSVVAMRVVIDAASDPQSTLRERTILVNLQHGQLTEFGSASG
jgi:hypothetical protein